MVTLQIGAGKPNNQKTASRRCPSSRDVSGKLSSSSILRLPHLVSPAGTFVVTPNLICIRVLIMFDLNREVQDELKERKGIDIPATRVIITSDERDPAWWAEVQALGWVPIDHGVMRTEEAYGKWLVAYHVDRKSVV